MYGEQDYEHALRGETLNEIRRILELFYAGEPITASQLINDVMWEAGYMGDDEE